MKRVVALLVCLALLALGGCGVPMQKNGVEWTTVNLRDEAYADVKAWLDEIDSRDNRVPEFETFDLSDTYELLVGFHEICLIDKGSKEKTLLLSEGDGYFSFGAVYNERFFLYSRHGGVVLSVQSVCAYDVETRKEIRLDVMDGMWLHFEGLRGDYAYLGDAADDEAPTGTRHLVQIDLRKLPEVEAVNLLKGIPQAKNVDETWISSLSPEGGTYMLGYDIYDLENRRFLAAVPADVGRPYYYDEKTIYCPIYGTNNALKITLP